MAQKYYNTQETAEILRKTPEEVKQMLDRRELHGYRDGADWKFKVEDIDQLARDMVEQQPAEDDGGDVLLSEVALGPTETGLSGTVIGLSGVGKTPSKKDAAADSDIALSSLFDSTAAKTPAQSKKEEAPKESKFEDLELALDDSSALMDNTPTMMAMGPGGGSSLDLSGRQSDDLGVLDAPSSSGSGVSLGADSGISLVDPADSGFSLETPINLEPAASESLVLGEDDLLSTGGSSAKTLLKSDDDFQLTPLEDLSDAESESGSQVIALDSEGPDMPVVGSNSFAGASMAAMLDEDLSAQPALDMGMGAPLSPAPALGMQPGALADGAPLSAVSAGTVVYETPYTGWQIFALSACLLLLGLCGMMVYDLLRTMWGGEHAQPFAVNSSIMDAILNLFEKK